MKLKELAGARSAIPSIVEFRLLMEKELIVFAVVQSFIAY